MIPCSICLFHAYCHLHNALQGIYSYTHTTHTHPSLLDKSLISVPLRLLSGDLSCSFGTHSLVSSLSACVVTLSVLVSAHQINGGGEPRPSVWPELLVASHIFVMIQAIDFVFSDPL